MAPFELGRMLPDLTPADWGLQKMTVCIAAICEYEKKIVTVTDEKINFGVFSADALAEKSFGLHRDWFMLCAGDDMEHVPGILDRTIELLHRKPTTKTWLQVATALSRAYEERLQEHIRLKVLAKYGFSVASFRDTGRKKLTATAFNSIISRIANVDLRLRFLCGGFDKNRKAHLFVVDGRGAPESYDEVGFWAIGDGAPAAISSMAFHAHRFKLRFYSSIAETIYHTCEAKFMAESSGDGNVGQATSVGIHEQGKLPEYIWPTGLKEIKDRWKRSGVPRAPKGLIEKIPAMIANCTKDEILTRLQQEARKAGSRKGKREAGTEENPIPANGSTR